MAFDREARPARPARGNKRRKVCQFCAEKCESIDYKDAAKPKDAPMSQRAPRPRTVSKARSVSAAPVKGMPAASAAPSTPEQQMARPVRVQITRVSKKTPVMLISPCRSGSSVSAQAAAPRRGGAVHGPPGRRCAVCGGAGGGGRDRDLGYRSYRPGLCEH